MLDFRSLDHRFEPTRFTSNFTSNNKLFTKEDQTVHSFHLSFSNICHPEINFPQALCLSICDNNLVINKADLCVHKTSNQSKTSRNSSGLICSCMHSFLSITNLWNCAIIPSEVSHRYLAKLFKTNNQNGKFCKIYRVSNQDQWT